MKKPDAIKIAVSLVLLAASVVLFIKLSPARQSENTGAYFYDLQEQKLFVAPQGSIPPIDGMKGAAGASVRAIVIAPNGDPSDKKHLQIAYLEEYSPEIKALFEEVHKARLAGRSEEGRINRKEVAANTLVRRLQDKEWEPIDSAEGEKIANEWNTPGPDGRMPVVCSP
ncbi:MAG TPA: hypothetical protein VMR33_13560 [Candidatus Baltobacteraceae bacterium]|jgi:hypothetical protein|nr:hypothetical protein [Candidatus Baltobacteraceae bacterium]